MRVLPFGARCAPVGPAQFLRSLQIEGPPDVVVVNSETKTGTFRSPSRVVDNATALRTPNESNHSDETAVAKTHRETLYGRRIRRFSSSQVRAHLMCAADGEVPHFPIASNS